jgi:hypothetical protein
MATARQPLGVEIDRFRDDLQLAIQAAAAGSLVPISAPGLDGSEDRDPSTPPAEHPPATASPSSFIAWMDTSTQ